MAKKTTKKKKAVTKTENLVGVEYTEEEKTSLAKYQELAKRKPIKFKKVEGKSGVVTIDFEYPGGQLRRVKLSEAFGTADPDLHGHLLEQVAQTFKETVSSDGQDNKAAVVAVNKAMAILNGIQPQDEIEGMLAIQMVGVHNMAMNCISKATRTDRVDFMSSYVNGATKLLRTFAAQMEALKRYRTTSQIKMIVGNLHVNNGGQAIVGTVNQGVEKTI